MSLWYVRKDGQTLGPSPAEQITREILLGRIRENDALSTDRAHWHPLRNLPQLIPEVMRHADTEEGRQKLLLARLRVDDRGHERRGAGYAPEEADRRYGDRRTVDSFEALGFDTHLQDKGEAENRNVLIPSALIMLTLFMLAVYFLW